MRGTRVMRREARVDLSASVVKQIAVPHNAARHLLRYQPSGSWRQRATGPHQGHIFI